MSMNTYALKNPKPSDSLVRLMVNAAEYLLSNEECVECRVPHNGRRAYIWPVCRWLDNYDSNADWKSIALKVAGQLMPNVIRNSSGSFIIYPGLEVTRNFSSNAIDCGIFLDSAHDLFKLVPSDSKRWQSCIDKMAITYNSIKIAGPKIVPNQILWCASGLARWVGENQSKKEVSDHRHLLENVLSEWANLISQDGWSPYSVGEHVPWYHTSTTYYHSRCICFAFYILDQLKVKRLDLEEKIVCSAEFLLKMTGRDGIKQLCLDAKRYYFWGPFEVASNPYDIYVYWKMFSVTGEDYWRRAAGNALKHLFTAQRSDGGISSQLENCTHDWQCDIMRTSHLAWLTRIPVEFLNDAENVADQGFQMPEKFFKYSRSDRLLTIGTPDNWVHFLTNKTPLCGFAGQRATGLMGTHLSSINNLSIHLPLSYSLPMNPVRSLQRLHRTLRKSLGHSIWHAYYCLFYKRRLRQAWLFFRDGFLTFSKVALTERRTEFACSIPDLEIYKRKIRHTLIVTDIGGSSEEKIGRREITWGNDEIQVIDHLTRPNRHKIFLGNFMVSGTGRKRGHYYYIEGPETIKFNAKISDL